MLRSVRCWAADSLKITIRLAFRRNIRNYDAYSMLFDWSMPEPFRLFLSREWHDMLAHLSDVPSTGDVTGGFHHHRKGSKSGQIHNDLKSRMVC